EKIAAATKRMDKAIADATPAIQAAIELLERIVAVEMSMERASLLGSAHKRQAMIAAIEGDSTPQTAALVSMKSDYERAETFGRANRIEGFYYPALNRLSAEF